MISVSFVDELMKIATDAATPKTEVKPLGGFKPITPTISESLTTGKIGLKPNTKGTDYTSVNSQPSGAATGTADGAKSATPPPVVA